MLDIKYDISYPDISMLDGEEKIIWISSDDKQSCDIVFNVIKNIFFNDSVLFRAIGFPDNIQELLYELGNITCNYYEGDSKKIFVRKYPELFAVVDDKKVLNRIIDNWISTIYEGRFFYILPPNNYSNLKNILISKVYTGSTALLQAWKYLDCFIENVQEAENHNTFILVVRKQCFDEVKRLLKNQ